MISIISSLISGIILGIRTPLFSPLIYLSSRISKDLFLLSFLAYSISLCYEFKVSNIYSSDIISIFIALIPALLLLDSGIKNGDGIKLNSTDLISALLILFGISFKFAFVLGVFLALINKFFDESTKKGIFSLILSISLLIVGLILGKSSLDVIAASPMQVAFIASISIIVTLLFWRRIERVDFMDKHLNKKSFKFSNLKRIDVPLKGRRKNVRKR